MANRTPWRCPTCQTLTTTKHNHYTKPPRNHTDEHQRQRLLQQWKTHNGDWCPGDNRHPPHTSYDLTIDHLKPQAKGGTLTDGWRIICRQANSRRGTTPTP